MNSLNIHAINYKDGWRQSIFYGCSGEFQAFLWWEFAHFPFLFDAHVGGCPCVDQIAHKKDVFVCDYVVTIKICQGQLYIHYSNPTMKYTSNVFKEFHDLLDYIHNKLHIKLKGSSLDFNTLGVEYLWFGFASFTFWATSLDAHGQKIQVSQEIFNGLVDVTKASCSCFLFQPILSFSSFEFVWICVYLSNEYILNTYEYFFCFCLSQSFSVWIYFGLWFCVYLS